MTDLIAGLVRHACSSVGGQRIALHENEFRPHVSEHGGELGGQVVIRLREPRKARQRRQRQIAANPEFFEGSLDHARMLAAVDDYDAQTALHAQLPDHRRELDAFGSRAGDHKDQSACRISTYVWTHGARGAHPRRFRHFREAV